MQTINGSEGTEKYNVAEMLFGEYREAMGTDMGMETKIDTVD